MNMLVLEEEMQVWQRFLMGKEDSKKGNRFH